MSRILNSITFFHSDDCERQAVLPIAEEAARRGFAVNFSSDLTERVQIGVYCQHACRPNADFSIIMLHDLAQRHDIWPEFWQTEPWHHFDIGLVPGPAWAERWSSQADQRTAWPKLGVFNVGWPKADLVYQDKARFAVEAAKLRDSLGLEHPQTVLYAPSWENDAKQDDFVKALIDLPVNLLLKQAPWSPDYKQVWDNINAMNALHQGIASNVHIVDPKVSILYCLGLADVLVSDESSVLIEAALLDVPAVSISDWMIPDRDPPRPACVPFDLVLKSTRAGLRSTVEQLLADPLQAKRNARALRDRHFAHLGKSASLIMDVLQAALAGEPLPQEPLSTAEGQMDLRAASKRLKLSEFVQDSESGVWSAGHQTHFGYSDGDATEQKIGRIVANADNVDVFSQELIEQIDDWPSEYHFSPRRANLMRWLDGLDSTARVLELGCGCGAITKALAEAGCQIDAVEGSTRRASIAAQRVRNHEGVKVFHSNFQDIEFEPLYDIVTLIGVLEYSPVYLNAEDPFVAGLKMAAGALKPGGLLVFAIENKVGLKYLAGLSEDHCAIPYYGVEDRYGVHEATTFGKRQLRKRLQKAGFRYIDFSYPYPDYKMPEVILSERAVVHEDFNASDLIGSLENRDYFGVGQPQFSLPLAWKTLGAEGLLGELANSFLICARLDDGERFVRSNLLAQKFTDNRAPAYNCVTEFVEQEASGISVVKKKMMPAAKENSHRSVIRQVMTHEQYVSGSNLGAQIKQAFFKGQRPRAFRLLKCWLQTLRDNAVDNFLPPDWLDAIPANLILDEHGRCHLIDREWHYSQPLPLELVVFRSLVVIAIDLAEALPAANVESRVLELCQQLDIEYSEKWMTKAGQLNAQTGLVQFEGGRWRADRYRYQDSDGESDINFNYSQWMRERNVTSLKALQERVDSWGTPLSFVLVIIDDADFEGEVLQSLRSQSKQLYPPAQVYVLSSRPAPHGIDEGIQWLSASDHWSVMLAEAIAQMDGDWIQLLHAGDQLDPFALLLLADRIRADSNIVVYYGDEDQLCNDIYQGPLFKPDFNLDMMRSYPYVGRSLAFERRRTLEIGGLNATFGELAPHDLVFRSAEAFGLGSIGHLDEVIVHAGISFGTWLANPDVGGRCAALVTAHLDRLQVAHETHQGTLPFFNRILYLSDSRPLVSIIIPSKDQLSMLQRCVESLLEKTLYQRYEILIVDNNSESLDARTWLQGLEALGSDQVRVLRYPHAFNYSAINNLAAREARGEYLLLLNNDTAVIQPEWLDNLLNHALRPEVGIVGAKLLYPDGRLQHGGVVLGLDGPADHPFIGEPGDASGYMHRLMVDQNYSAVTAACLLIRKSVYDGVGGMDEGDFKVSYNDVDLCLKVGQAGYLTVWTPYSLLLHEGSVSQNNVDMTPAEAKRKRFKGEQDVMYKRWLPLLARDPAYNSHLDLNGAGFGVDPGKAAAWQPFTQSLLPRFLCCPADDSGCGHYRVREPFNSLQKAELAEGLISENFLSPVELARLDPDVIVLQRQITTEQLDSMASMKAFNRAFRIYELDDYLPGVPLKSYHRADMPKDILRSLRRALSLTDRFVVSTAPLAEAFADLHDDIRIAPNFLPTRWWSGLEGQRRAGRKPRVGWAGGAGHAGDLELIADVVRDLADEVEWVFFGMCPDQLLPYVHEYHYGVPIDQYPKRLAALNLDLALAPLEQNKFNDCKSNLRLLEYGALGLPVICSDVLCYRGDLPVTRVKNRYRDWIDAIRLHLSDLDAAERQGDLLQQVVHRHWMLEGENLLRWQGVWLPD